MPRKREFDIEKALDAAMGVFWEKGFHATSISDLTERMGIERPSIYSTFGDKRGLFETALRKYNSAHAARIRSQLQSKPSVKEGFRRFFEGIAAQDNMNNPNWGCFCINSMVELSPHDEKFEILTREHQMYLSALFQETIERGMRTGELNADLDARELAHTLVVSLIGLTVMMKSRPDRSFTDHTINGILANLR
ncbi:TetR/AcrR family transcriptional regulator [Candidatus Pristimantibacillus sp. PTI5]|uniref:TetR/AcrR family transcriptional regulator n=1 Tax=Candidatus Pristimantibacillus sp. PTI5 TaxID=3400422 RepID=UPI003B01B097